jgi:hypothetical protein
MRTSVALLLVLVPTLARAQYEPGLRDVMHARSLAMGEAVHGVGLGADTVDGNPAMMSVFRRYQIELSGTWDPGNKFADGSLAICDSQTNPMAAGVSYQVVSLGQGETRRTAHLNTLALGFPLLENLHVGVAGRYLLMSGAATANALTLDAGLALKLTDGLTVGATGHNLIDVRHPELSRYYVFSAGYVSGLFSLGADVRADLGSPTGAKPYYSGGLEYAFGGTVPVRVGYAYDTGARSHFLSGGLGLFTEGGGVDLSYRHELTGPGRVLALTLKFQPPVGAGG